MNILVINLTRFGDLLQTQPVIHALKAQGHRVGLACLANFAPATELLTDLDYVAVLPGGGLLADLDTDWRNALLRTHDYVTTLQQEFPVEGIVNTTATLSARLLCRRLTTGDIPVWGFALDEDGFGINGNAWATFLQGSTMRRLNCPFNIVDMFRMTADCGHIPPVNRLRAPSAMVLQEVENLLAQHAGNLLHKGFVSFQLGASEARRQWPVKAFAQLGDKLWQELGLVPVLLGAPAERPLAEAYAAATSSPFVDGVGATDIPHLAGLLKYSRMLVTNDTGTMHLAAGLDVPVLALFLATAQAWDTGPYRGDCCCLEPALSCHPCAFDSQCPHNNMCLDTISPHRVWELVRHYLTTGQWVAEAAPPIGTAGAPLTDASARVWLTGTDGYGFAHLHCVSGHGGEDRSVWLAQQRQYYRQIIDGMDGNDRAADHSSAAPYRQGELSAPFRQTVHTALRQGEELLHLLLEQGIMLQKISGDLPKQRFLASCNRVRSLFEHCIPLCALGHVWTVILQERGGDIQSILRMALVLQQTLSHWRKSLEN